MFQTAQLRAALPVGHCRCDRVGAGGVQLRDGAHEQRGDSKSAGSRPASDPRRASQEASGRPGTARAQLPDADPSALQSPTRAPGQPRLHREAASQPAVLHHHEASQVRERRQGDEDRAEFPRGIPGERETGEDLPLEPACREEDLREEAAAHSAEAGPGKEEDGRLEEVPKFQESRGDQRRTGWPEGESGRRRPSGEQEALRQQQRQDERPVEAREEQRQEAELSGPRGGQGRLDEEEQRQRWQQDVQAGRLRRAQDPLDERASRLEEHGEGEETPEEGSHVVLRADQRQIGFHEHPQEFPGQRETEGVLRHGEEPQARLLSPSVTLITTRKNLCVYVCVCVSVYSRDGC